MTDRFEKAFRYVLEYEGSKYVNDPTDRGGETKFGISRRSYRFLDIKKLTEKDAKKIYYCDFWIKGPFEKIEDEKLAIKLFDFTINMGAKQAGKLLQRALRSVGKEVREDGIIGPNSLDAINSSDPEHLLIALRSEAAGFYRLLVAEDSKQGRFLYGWLNRAYA